MPSNRTKKLLPVAVIVIVLLTFYHSPTPDASHLSFFSFGRSDSSWPKNGTRRVDFDTTEAFDVRQELAQNFTSLLQQYQPPSHLVDKNWLEKWPPMPGFQLGNEYDRAEVEEASRSIITSSDALHNFKAQQRELMDTIPKWVAVSKGYSGRGVVISAGSLGLSRVWPNVVLMLKSLKSRLPVEIWTKDRIEFDFTLPLVHQMREELGIDISLHLLSDYMDIKWDLKKDWTSIFKVKALALLFSTFEEVLLLDADSIPVMDPNDLFETREARAGLLQWPDFWANSLSNPMHEIYGIDWQMHRTCESGQILIDKKKQFESLVLANYFNWWGPDFFYKIIYLDGMGIGDKDTFWLGAAAYGREYYVVERKTELITAKKTGGGLWREQLSVFNGAMAQFNPSKNREVFFMHMHAPKISMNSDDVKGQFDLLFFTPDDDQDVVFTSGAEALESALWENLAWVECESVLKDDKSDATCNGVRDRVERNRGSSAS